MVTESWLSQDIDDHFLGLPRYRLFRSDRVGRRGGGVCTWVDSMYRPVLFVPDGRPSCIECLFLNLFVGPRRIICCNIYVPPGLSRSDHISIVTFLTDVFDGSLKHDAEANIIFAGDVNDFSIVFLEEHFNLLNKVKSPTRRNSFLDVILVDEELSEFYESNAIVGPPVRNSDHNSVLLIPFMSDTHSSRPSCVPVWDFRESFILEFLNRLTVTDFGHIESLPSVDDMVEEFYRLLHNCVSAIPCEFIRISKSDKPWITPVLKLLIQKRWLAFRTKNWQLYRHYKAKVQREITNAKRIWAERQRRTPKGVWNIVKEFSGKRSNDPLSHIGTSSTDLARDLTEIFKRNFNFDDDIDPSPITDINMSWDFVISSSDVFFKLKKLNRNKANGPDLVPTRLLICGAHLVSHPLCLIFNRSIKERTFPSAFKHAYVCPIPKKLKPSIHDFRPISILPVIGKVFERLVLDGMRNQLIDCFSPTQHAYRPGGSTTTALVYIHDTITRLLDRKDTKAVRVMCLDLSKAFDKLHHQRLLQFLKSKGLCNGFLTWLSSYLSMRQFQVKVKNVFGPLVKTPSGVPQGSVLGPILFAAFMASISFPLYDASLFSVQYADDVTLLEALKSPFDRMIPISYIEEQFRDAGLTLNRGKCQEMIVSCSYSFSLPINACLSRVQSAKILGVIFSDSLTWSAQFSDLLKRAARRLYLIRALKNVISDKELIIVYHAVVTSLLLYAAPVYGRVPDTLLNKLQRLQNRAHAMICGKNCTCVHFLPIADIFRSAGLKFLEKCERTVSSPLHKLVPPRLPRCGQFRIPSCTTSRRLHSCIPWFCLQFNIT